MKVGDTVRILIGNYRGEHAVIKKIEFNAGAKNGWFLVCTARGVELLLASEEIEPAEVKGESLALEICMRGRRLGKGSRWP